MNLHKETLLLSHGTELKDRCKFETTKKRIVALIDTSKLNLQQSEELEDVLELLIHLAMYSMIQMFTTTVPIEEVKKRYQTKLRLLKTGIYKEGKEL